MLRFLLPIAPLAALGYLLFPGLSSAHDPGLSSAVIRVGAEVVEAYLEIDSAALHGASLDADALRIEIDGRAAPLLEVRPLDAEPGHAGLLLRYARPEGARLRVTSGLLPALPFGHRQFLRIEEIGVGRRTDRVLDARAASAEIELSSLVAPAEVGSVPSSHR